MEQNENIILFNSPLETGLRSLCILSSAYPESFDLQQLIAFDHIAVHTGDIEGAPSSLHPIDPKRNGELLVRRPLIERGLLLMESKKLLTKIPTPEGFQYKAVEFSSVFLASLTTTYIQELLKRSKWVIDNFQSGQNQAFTAKKIYENSFDRWANEFQFTKISHSSDQGVI